MFLKNKTNLILFIILLVLIVLLLGVLYNNHKRSSKVFPFIVRKTYKKKGGLKRMMIFLVISILTIASILIYFSVTTPKLIKNPKKLEIKTPTEIDIILTEEDILDNQYNAEHNLTKFNLTKGVKNSKELGKKILKFAAPRGSENVYEKTEEEENDYLNVVSYLLEHGYNDNFLTSWIDIAPSLKRFYTLTIFEAKNKKETLPSTGKSRSYCCFTPSKLNSDGFIYKDMGLFVIANKHDSNLHLAAPHANSDSRTGSQVLEIFSVTGARTALIPTHHRFQTAKVGCQARNSYQYPETDEAHTTNTYYNVIKLLADYYGDDYKGLEFHGFSKGQCPVDVFIANGKTMKIIDHAVKLKENLRKFNKKWIVASPLDDSPVCNLNGGGSTTGRYLNGVEGDVCPWVLGPRRAKSISGKFVQIEQGGWSINGGDEIRAAKHYKKAIIATYNK